MLQSAVYDRQNRISNLRIPNVASVVGCGGTGFWTAVFLAMSGVEELILVDPDTLEVSNLNRLPVDERNVGIKKTVATKEFINKIRATTRVEHHEIHIQNPEDCTVLRGDVFCCTDNLKSQQIICAYCKKNRVAYQRIGYDGTILNVSRAFPLSFEESLNQGGYTITPSWVIPAVLAAAAGVSSRLYKELCLMDDIGNLHVQTCSFVPEKILDDAREEEREEIMDNIDDYIPDSYGYCDSCSRCDDCHRVDPDDGWGYCEDCDKMYSEKEVEDIREEQREEGFVEAVDQIKSGDVEDPSLKEALEQWKKEVMENDQL